VNKALNASPMPLHSIKLKKNVRTHYPHYQAVQPSPYSSTNPS
jgi:hypothetical protein